MPQNDIDRCSYHNVKHCKVCKEREKQWNNITKEWLQPIIDATEKILKAHTKQQEKENKLSPKL